MSLELAIDYARRLPLNATSSPAVKSEPRDLTEREREVAALVAQGRTNGEIADDLVLSKRTVEKHVASLFAKLSLTNRAQLVRWALEQGLAVSPP